MSVKWERMKTTPLDVKSQITRLSPAGPSALNAWFIDFTGQKQQAVMILRGISCHLALMDVG